MLRVGKPGRHLFAHNCCTDGSGEGAGFFVGKQRHGGSFAAAMAALAVVLEDGENLLMEGDLGGRGCEAEKQGGNCFHVWGSLAKEKAGPKARLFR